jgi:hypothetical protein
MSDARRRTHDPDALEVLIEAAELYQPDRTSASEAGAALLEELKALDGLTKIRITPDPSPSKAHIVTLQAGAVRVWIHHLDGGQFEVMGGGKGAVGDRVRGLRFNPVTKELEDEEAPTPPAKRRRGVTLVLEAALMKAHKIRFPDAYKSVEPSINDRWPPVTNTAIVPRRRR